MPAAATVLPAQQPWELYWRPAHEFDDPACHPLHKAMASRPEEFTCYSADAFTVAGSAPAGWFEVAVSKEGMVCGVLCQVEGSSLRFVGPIWRSIGVAWGKPLDAEAAVAITYRGLSETGQL